MIPLFTRTASEKNLLTLYSHLRHLRVESSPGILVEEDLGVEFLPHLSLVPFLQVKEILFTDLNECNLLSSALPSS
jgi:hypothetical protein